MIVPITKLKSACKEYMHDKKYESLSGEEITHNNSPNKTMHYTYVRFTHHDKQLSGNLIDCLVIEI